jgi:hypothetical protein
MSNTLRMLDLLLGVRWDAAIRRMIAIMIDANHISERLVGMRQEISDLRVINARYWVKSQHTVLDKSAHALRQGRLLGIKQELSDMMKRCA